MKFRYQIIIATVLFAAVSCSKEETATVACAGSSVGTYNGATVDDQIVLADTCAYTYTGTDGCKSIGTYAAPLGSSGTVKVSINSASAGNCLTAGNYTCAYALQTPNLAFDCGSGVFNYVKE